MKKSNYGRRIKYLSTCTCHFLWRKLSNVGCSNGDLLGGSRSLGSHGGGLQSSLTSKQSNSGSNQTAQRQETKEVQGKACMFAAVSPTVFTHIMSLKKENEIWDYLKSEYEEDERNQRYAGFKFGKRI